MAVGDTKLRLSHGSFGGGGSVCRVGTLHTYIHTCTYIRSTYVLPILLCVAQRNVYPWTWTWQVDHSLPMHVIASNVNLDKGAQFLPSMTTTVYVRTVKGGEWKQVASKRKDYGRWNTDLPYLLIVYGAGGFATNTYRYKFNIL